MAAVAGLAIRLSEYGREEEAARLFEHSLRLSPKPPWWVPAGYGYALHLIGRKVEAVEWLKKAITLKPERAAIRARLAAVYADLGRSKDATAEAAEALRLKPGFTISGYQKSNPFRDPQRNAWLKDFMVRAGLPE